MKKLLIIGSVFLFFNNCIAQNGLSVGISVIPQVYSAIGNNYVFVTTTDSREAKINLSGGLSFDYRLNENLSILSGVFYQPHGISKEVLKDAPSHIYLETKIDYLRLHVLVSFDIIRHETLKFSIITGLGYNHRIYAKDNMQYLANFFTDGTIDTPSERYNKTMLDGQFSLGLEKTVSNSIVIFGQADFVMGITRFHSKYPDLVLDSRVFSIGISIGVKYALF